MRSSNSKRDSFFVSVVVMAAIATSLAGQANGDDPVIDNARKVASAFTESLPKYLVKRTTTRFQSTIAVCAPATVKKGQPCQQKESWQMIDTVTADVATENGKETYANVRLDGKPATSIGETGSWSEGEFSSIQWAIFSPESHALFTDQGTVTLASRPAWRYDFSIDQPHSSWHLSISWAVGYAPAYGGTIWIDRETSRVLRVEMSARNIPESLPLGTVRKTVEYAFVEIGGEDYQMPSHSEAIYCQKDVGACSRNMTDFKDYKKYVSDTSIRFEDPK